MKVTVNVKTNSKDEGVEPQPDGTLLVRVNVPPMEGKANERVVELVARHFKTAKSTVKIVTGAKFKRKVLAINE